jgi:hypothetical protein
MGYETMKMVGNLKVVVYFALVGMAFNSAFCCGDGAQQSYAAHVPTMRGLPASLPPGIREFPIEWQAEGAANLDLGAIGRSSEKPWGVFRIVPDAMSGVNHWVPPRLADGTYNNVNFIFGCYMIETQLGRRISSTTGTYRWQEIPMALNTQQFRKWSETIPFMSGSNSLGSVDNSKAVIVAQINEGQTGLALFTNVYPIPLAWKNDVKPALVYLRKHTELEALKPSPAAISEMHKLIGSRQPFLAVAAARGLNECKAFTRADMQTVLTNGDSASIASVLAIARLYGWPSFAQNDQWLLHEITTLATVYQLEGVTIAIVASNAIIIPKTQYDPPLGSVKDDYAFALFNRTALVAIRSRLKEIDPTGSTADPRWEIIDNYCKMFSQ